MAKLTLTPEPSFDAPVKIHVPGKGRVSVKFTFKHRTRQQAKALYEDARDGKFDSDAELVLALATGWELEDKFTAENVGLLVDSYAGAAGDILSTYFDELRGAREGN